MMMAEEVYIKGSGDSEDRCHLLEDFETSDIQKEKSLYENAIKASGFGLFHGLIILVSGWALASDSIEMQVVSFVLPSSCDLEMNSSEKGWLNAIIFIGMMFGGYLFGGAADVKGRRYVMIWSMSVNGLFGVVSAFAPTYLWFLLFRCLSGVRVGAAMPIIFAYCAEFMSTAKRGPVIGALASFWLVGNLLTCFLAWTIIPRVHLGTQLGYIVFSSWRLFVLIGGLPSLLSAFLMYLMPESPLFLQKAGKYEEACAVFIQMFKRNSGRDYPLPPEIKEFSEYYRSSLNPEDLKKDDSEPCGDLINVLELFKTVQRVAASSMQLFRPPFAVTTFLLVVIWYTLSFGFYGLWMWLPELFKRIESGSGSACSSVAHAQNQSTAMSSNLSCSEQVATQNEMYVESLIVALATVPGNVLTIVLVNKVGRRQLMAVSMVLSGVSVFFFPVVTSRAGMVTLLCIFSGTAVGGWNVLDMLAIENYPTDLRSTAFGVQSVFGRLAAICGNLVFGQLVDQHCAIPITMVAVLLGFGGLIALKLPRTDSVSLT